MELRTVATPGDAHDHEDAPLLMGERAAARPRAAPQTLNVVAMGRVAAVALTVATISALLTVVLPVSLSGPGGATGDQPVARHHGGTMATSLFSGNKVRQYTGRRLFSGADQFKVRFVVVLSRAGDSAHHPPAAVPKRFCEVRGVPTEPPRPDRVKVGRHHYHLPADRPRPAAR